MPVATSEKHVCRKLTVNLDQHQVNVRPIITGNYNISVAIALPCTKHYQLFQVQ